jgi:hypothetical protein
MLVMGVSILFIATYPYMKSLKEEQDFLDLLESKIKSKKGKSKIKIARRHLKK